MDEHKRKRAILRLRRRFRKSTRHSFPLSLLVVGLFVSVAFPRSQPLPDVGFEPEIELEVSAPKEPEFLNYFHPVWREDDSWLLFPTSDDEKLGLTEYQRLLEQVATDPDNRIEAEFKVPPRIKDRVVFWMLVHSRYSRQIRVVHDRKNPSLVYGYLDFRPLYRSLGATAALERKIDKIEKAVFKWIKGSFQNTLVVSPSEPPSEESEKVHAFLSKYGALSKERIKTLASLIRTQSGQSDEFMSACLRAERLLPHIESVMRQKGLPAGLARIPFVESSFHAEAKSRVGAMGVWQFMPETAAQMIHPYDRARWVDPIRQTRAASKLFQIFRKMLPDWGTAITSYNSGVGRLKKLVERYKLRGIEDLLQLEEAKTLGFAGQNFYAQFLSANLVYAYREELFPPVMSSMRVAEIFQGKSPFPEEICLAM